MRRPQGRLGSLAGDAGFLDALAAAHHLLLSHGRAVEILRSAAPTSEIGITLDLHPVYPASDEDADVAAAAHVDGFHNRSSLDPILRGSYPEDMLSTSVRQARRLARPLVLGLGLSDVHRVAAVRVWTDRRE